MVLFAMPACHVCLQCLQCLSCLCSRLFACMCSWLGFCTHVPFSNHNDSTACLAADLDASSGLAAFVGHFVVVACFAFPGKLIMEEGCGRADLIPRSSIFVPRWRIYLAITIQQDESCCVQPALFLWAAGVQAHRAFVWSCLGM